MAPTARGLLLRAALGLGVVTVAFSHSLGTLIQGLDRQTPLAYVGLVPLLAAGLAASRLRPQPTSSRVHDDMIDAILATALLGSAAAVLLWLPGLMSARFWVLRLDLVALPLFAAGVVVLLFGTHALWRLRLPLAFLLLAWPVPWVRLLGPALDGMTAATAAVVRRAADAMALATPLPGNDAGFRVGEGVRAFDVTVASSCSGVNSALGFLLVGGAFLAVLAGHRRGRIAWLLVGVGVTLTANVIRILLLLAVGRSYGEDAALGLLHSSLGIATLGIALLVMGLLAPVFGLRTRRPAVTADWPVLLAAATRRQRVRLAAVGLVAVPLAIANSGFGAYSVLADAAGAPRLAAFTGAPVQLSGWRAEERESFKWARTYFGANSTWTRYAYTGSAGATIWADAVLTSDGAAFDAYGVEACYRFHGYGVNAVDRVGLGAGLTATSLSYADPDRGGWVVVSWIWPVRTPGGDRWERVTLLRAGRAEDAAGLTETARAVVAGAASLRGKAYPPEQSARLLSDLRLR